MPAVIKINRTVKTAISTVILFFAVIGIIEAFFYSSPENISDPSYSPSVEGYRQETSTITKEGQEDAGYRVHNSNDFLVTRVIDGDTIEISNGQKVRLIGIDAPESVHPNRPVDCFGSEAAEYTRTLLEGKRIRMEKDISETDKYKRLLRYIWLDNLFVNEHLVKEGLATAVTYPPDVKYQTTFILAQTFARDNNKGMWSTCNISDSNPQTLGFLTNGLQSSNSTLPTDDWNCPESHPIKGNKVSMIYHAPLGFYYERTKPDECFATIDDASASGYRKSIR